MSREIDCRRGLNLGLPIQHLHSAFAIDFLAGSISMPTVSESSLIARTTSQNTNQAHCRTEESLQRKHLTTSVPQDCEAHSIRSGTEPKVKSPATPVM